MAPAYIAGTGTASALLVAILIAAVVALVVFVVFHLLVPRYERPAAAITFLVVLLLYLVG